MEQERKREAEEGEEKDIERCRDVLLPRPAIQGPRDLLGGRENFDFRPADVARKNRNVLEKIWDKCSSVTVAMCEYYKYKNPLTTHKFY